MKIATSIYKTGLLVIIFSLLIKFIFMAFEYDWEHIDFRLYDKTAMVSFAEHTKTGPGADVLRPLMSACLNQCQFIDLAKPNEYTRNFMDRLAGKEILHGDTMMSMGEFDSCDSIKSYGFKNTRIYCTKIKGDTLVFRGKLINW